MEELEFTVEDLVEGGEYEFRVKAVNEAGVSKPSATVGPVTVKDQTCTYLTENFLLWDCIPGTLTIKRQYNHQSECPCGLHVGMDTFFNHV